MRSRSVLGADIPRQPRCVKRHFSAYTSRAYTTEEHPTDAAETRPHNQQEAELHQRILEICDDTVIPYGEFGRDLWDESLKVLKEMSSHHTALGLECSCMLMERLVIEQGARKTSMTSKANETSFSSLTAAHLNGVVQNWETCWKKGRVTVAPTQMLSLLDDWLYRLEHDLHPDVETYTTLIQGAMFCRINPEAARSFAENLFKRMVAEDDDHRHPNVRPNTATYDAMIHGLSNYCGDVPRAEFYLNQMCLEAARHSNRSVELNVRSFTSVLRAYSRIEVENDPHNEVPERAHAMLRHMQYLDTLGTSANVKPDQSAFVFVLTCWAKSKHPQAAARVKELYEEMRADPNAKPSNAYPLSQVLMKLAEVGDADTAKTLLDEHLRALPNSLDGTKINNSNHVQGHYHKCFESVMRAWERSGRPEALKQIEELIDRMKELAASQILPETKLGRMHYHCYISCVDKSSGILAKKDIVAKIEGIVKEMEELAAAGSDDVKPDAYTYTMLLLAHATHGQDPYKAEAVLEHMYQRHLEDGKSKSTQPNVRSFNVCLKAWAQSQADNAPERADGILGRMWKLHETGILENVKPDAISYTTVMMCHVRSRSPGRGRRCQDLLEEMEARSVPSVDTCYILPISTWISVGDVQKAEESLDHFIMQHQNGKIKFKPNEVAFKVVSRAWAKSKHPTAAARIEGLIHKMQEHFKSGLLKQPPTRSMYEELLKSHYFSGETWAGENAERVLQKMEALAANSRHLLTAPTTDDYNSKAQTSEYVLFSYGSFFTHAFLLHALLQSLCFLTLEKDVD
jgi:Pentatricopeptide repeat domain